jgi:hypothetical protein
MAMKKKKSITKTNPAPRKEVPVMKNREDPRNNPAHAPNPIVTGISRSVGKMVQRTRNFLLGATGEAEA